MSEENISKSKQKRINQEKAREEQKVKDAMGTIIGVGVVLLLLIAVAAITIGRSFFNKSEEIDYSKYLTEEGLIDVNIDEYCTTTYENITVSNADIMPTDEFIDSQLDSFLAGYKSLEDDASLEVSEEDTVLIAYASTIDGVSFNEVSKENGGTEYTIGSEMLSADFDTALIGHHPGDIFDFDVTYAADYYDDSMAGKTVSYNVELISIYVVPEFDDEFVAQNLSEYASTADGYVEYITDEFYKSNLRNAIADSISENCVITGYPEEYVDYTEKVIRQTDKQQYEYFKQIYAQYGLTLSNVWEIYGLTTEAEYNDYVANLAKETVGTMLCYQAIFTKAGLTLTPDEVRQIYIDNGIDPSYYEEYTTQYGYPYLANTAMQRKVIDYLADTVTITD